MLGADYAEALLREGFQPVGSLHYRLQLTAWWNAAPDKRLQVIVLPAGRATLVKGDKSYYLKSVGPEGETWARDVPALHDYLEAHFPELRISFSHFRDVPPELAEAEVRRRMAVDAPTQPPPTVEEMARLQRRIEATERESQADQGVMSLLSGAGDLLTGYLHQQGRARRAEVDQMRDELERKRQRLSFLQHLQREYQRKGSAAVYTFSVSSNVQVAESIPQFQDALRAVVRELTDLHRYQVAQKLNGGRLQIQVADATEPAVAWIEQWFGGALTPSHTRRLGSEFDLLRRAATEQSVVTPDEPIHVGDHVRHAEKRLAARFVSDVLHRLDGTQREGPSRALSPERVPPETMPLSLGRGVDDAGRLTEPVSFPLTQMVHLYVSGTTGGGKSFLARVLVEEAAHHRQLGVLVLDPRNQSVGLLVPEDRPQILQQYGEFGMKPGEAHGFAFSYFAPALPSAPPPPGDLSQLARGRSIVSFKGMDDQRRCALAARILGAAFDACSGAESDGPRLLIVVDEAQLFTRKRLDESAKPAAAQAERALDRIAREGRKFGVVLALVSQTMKDFGYELASIRQMTTTKIFLRNSDREIDYAADILGDGRQLVQLPTGTALVHNANWGVVRIRVRPPYSKVFEPGEAETRRLVGYDKDPSSSVTADAKSLLAVIKEHGSPPAAPLNMSRAGALAGISSKRRLLDLVDELERVGAIRTRKLMERGQPRVIEPAPGLSGLDRFGSP